MHFIRVVFSAMRQWQSGARPRGQSAPARCDMWGVFRSAFPGVAPTPRPPGCRENGRALSSRPIRYAPRIFETSRQTFTAFPYTSRRLTHGKRAERAFCVLSLPHSEQQSVRAHAHRAEHSHSLCYIHSLLPRAEPALAEPELAEPAQANPS